MCRACGREGGKFLEGGRCRGGGAVPSEQSPLCRKPAPRPPCQARVQPAPPASSSWVPGMPSPRASATLSAAQRLVRGLPPRGMAAGASGILFPKIAWTSRKDSPGRPAAPSPLTGCCKGQKKWNFLGSLQVQADGSPRLCRNWAERRTDTCQDEAKGRTRRAGPGFSPAPTAPRIPPLQFKIFRTSVFSTYHRLANADSGLGDGLGGLVFKAFWKCGGMPPFPGLQRELVSNFKCLSQR